MKKHSAFFLILLMTIIAFPARSQKPDYKTNFKPAEFAGLIKENPSLPVIDVRTPEEFEKGHLDKALNYDWYGKNFDKQIASLGKNEPVLVYCKSGGRSSEAAAKMRSSGFEKVYELEGGFMKWRAAGLPEIANADPEAEGMTVEQFNALLNREKKVLVDFYAEWCGPCKKMKPYLEEISRDMAENVIVVRINVDENRSLCQQLKIEEIPVLQVYDKGIMTWNHAGFIDKKQVVARLK